MGVILGFGVAELFGAVASMTMGQTDTIINLVKGEIAGLGDTFADLLEHDCKLLTLTREDAVAIAEQYPFHGFKGKKGDVRDSDDYWLFYMLKSSYIDAIYIVDTNELVDLGAGLGALFRRFMDEGKLPEGEGQGLTVTVAADPEQGPPSPAGGEGAVATLPGTPDGPRLDASRPGPNQPLHSTPELVTLEKGVRSKGKRRDRSRDRNRDRRDRKRDRSRGRDRDRDRRGRGRST